MGVASSERAPDETPRFARKAFQVCQEVRLTRGLRWTSSYNFVRWTGRDKVDGGRGGAPDNAHGAVVMTLNDCRRPPREGGKLVARRSVQTQGASLSFRHVSRQEQAWPAYCSTSGIAQGSRSRPSSAHDALQSSLTDRPAR